MIVLCFLIASLGFASWIALSRIANALERLERIETMRARNDGLNA